MYTLDRKMNDPFFDGHDELYHRAKFGEDRTEKIVQRAPAVGSKMWCLFFFVCLFVTLRVRSAVRSRGA